jgi:hypothetical protein
MQKDKQSQSGKEPETSGVSRNQTTPGADVVDPGPSTVQASTLKGATAAKSPSSAPADLDLAAQSDDRTASEFVKVEQRSPSHFAVVPESRNSDFCAWLYEIPNLRQGNILASSYLRYEHGRLEKRMDQLKNQYHALTLSGSESVTIWRRAITNIATSAVAACFHKNSWAENWRWLEEGGYEDGPSWPCSEEGLWCQMDDMVGAQQGAIDQARGVAKAEVDQQLGVATVQGLTFYAHRRLQEVRGELPETRAEI